MTLLGQLLRNRRAGETHLAWNLPNLDGPELLTLSSKEFEDGAAMAKQHCAKYAGGANLSPQLSWTTPPSGTAQLLLVVEDVDVPVGKPAVHCVALIDPELTSLAPGELGKGQPVAGVRLLRSVLGRGYQGPAPVKGHGAHRYVFQLFALPSPVTTVGSTPADRARPRTLLAAVAGPVLARTRLTGTYER